jgi:hypothetical protein
MAPMAFTKPALMAHETTDGMAGAVVSGSARRHDHRYAGTGRVLAGGMVNVCCQLW